MLEVILAMICVVLFLALTLSVYRIIQLVRIQESLENQVEESLDILDLAYREISVATMTEVFSDEPVVRRAVAAIRSSQEAVLRVANKLVSFDDDGEIK